jgi:hypothetical protein
MIFEFEGEIVRMKAANWFSGHVVLDVVRE